MVSLQDVRRNPQIIALIDGANRVMEAIGYTDHGPRHCACVCRVSSYILESLGYPQRVVELAAIAGWVHDVGNAVNRKNHGLTGATLLYPILKDMNMPLDEVLTVVSAVGNHEEETGRAVSPVSAALILADKSEAHRTRVRRGKYDPNDIHDRVNYAISDNRLVVDAQKRVIRHEMVMEEHSSIVEFMQIYLSRVAMSERAAAFLDCAYQLVFNDVIVSNPVAE